MKTHKGSIIDVVFLVVMFTLVAVGVVVVYATTSRISTALQAEGINGTSEVEMFTSTTSAIADFNAILAFVYVGINLATAISAFMVRSHPIMFLVFFIVQVVAVFISGQMVEVWNVMATEFSTDVLLFGWVSAIFANYGVLTLIFSLIVALAMMAIPL